MSTRSGNSSKKAQKYQNTFAFRHNKNSILTRKIRETPLDHLCKRCLEKLEWRINYRKYKPLSAAARCNICQDKTIYKAYRTICDKCGETHKICTKCCEPVKEYSKPSCRRNDPYAKLKQESPLEEIMKNLKERHKRTIERKLDEGEDIIFDNEKGIINDETGEVIIDIKIIRGDFTTDNLNDESDEKDDSRKDNQDKKQEGFNIQEIVENNKNDKEDLLEEGDYEDDSDEEDKEINK